jgi:hypothetical protein
MAYPVLHKPYQELMSNTIQACVLFRGRQMKTPNSISDICEICISKVEHLFGLHMRASGCPETGYYPRAISLTLSSAGLIVYEAGQGESVESFGRACTWKHHKAAQGHIISFPPLASV